MPPRRPESVRPRDRALALPVRASDLLARRYLNLARLLQAQGDKDRVRAMAQAVLATEAAAGKPTFISTRAQALLQP